MDTRLTELCARQLEKLFENPTLLPGTGMATIPIVGGLYIPDLEPDHSQFIPMIIAALAARAKFHRDAPESPILPLRQEDCEEMMNDDRPRVQVVGLFGDSWRYAGWDQKHPSFRRYCCGLLACDYAPDEIRTDRSLQYEFPARPLKGLCGGALYWRSPAMLAFDRERQRACDAFMARERMDAPR